MQGVVGIVLCFFDFLQCWDEFFVDYVLGYCFIVFLVYDVIVIDQECFWCGGYVLVDCGVVFDVVEYDYEWVVQLFQLVQCVSWVIFLVVVDYVYVFVFCEMGQYWVFFMVGCVLVVLDVQQIGCVVQFIVVYDYCWVVQYWQCECWCWFVDQC